ncbi:MAG: BtpA/SgcQ family protein [Roseinatronobacter sp.]
MTLPLFRAPGPLVIAALHLPDFQRSPRPSVAWLEDHVLTNARVFAQSGIPWIKLQDATRTAGPASPETLALMGALGRLIRREYPGLGLGIIIEAHDPTAAIAVAQATGADFVRLKVFAGGVMTAQGPRYGLGAEALAYRDRIGAQDVACLADVHDRTAVSLGTESQGFAAEWCVKTGADGLIITGSDLPDTCARIAALRARGITRPVLIGGSVTAGNVAQALAAAEGVIVSTALMRKDAAPTDLLRWDRETCLRFMDAAREQAA